MELFVFIIELIILADLRPNLSNPDKADSSRKNKSVASLINPSF
jgi:hypothetical protein